MKRRNFAVQFISNQIINDRPIGIFVASFDNCYFGTVWYDYMDHSYVFAHTIKNYEAIFNIQFMHQYDEIIDSICYLIADHIYEKMEVSEPKDPSFDVQFISNEISGNTPIGTYVATYDDYYIATVKYNYFSNNSVFTYTNSPIRDLFYAKDKVDDICNLIKKHISENMYNFWYL